MKLSKRQVAHMLDKLTRPGTSARATTADAAALVAASEAFAAAFCDREVKLEDVEQRARQLADANEGNGNAAADLVELAAAAACRVWP